MSRAQSQLFRGTPSLEAEEKRRFIEQIIANEFGDVKNTQRLQRQFALDKLPFEEVKKIAEGKSSPPSNPMSKSAPPSDPMRDRAATNVPVKRPQPPRPGVVTSRPSSPSPSVVTAPSIPTQAKEAFPVRLSLATGENILATAYTGATASEFMNEAFQKIKEYLEPNTTIESLALVTEEGPIKSSEIFADHPYINKCRKQTDIAVISVVPASSIEDTKSSSEVSAPAQVKPLPIPTPKTAPVQPSYDDYPTGELPKPPVRTDSSGVINKPKSMIAQAQHFKNVLNEKLQFQSLTQSMARTATKKQIREFQIQFLLPGGSSEIFMCNVDMTVAQTKEELHKRTAKKSKLRPMEKYFLKTPSVDGYLSEEGMKLSEIAFIEQCRTQSTTPKLILVEKNTAFSKKEKLINLEIGSLIGSPLCWTQDDSEITQLRKTMTWVRYQDKKESKETPQVPVEEITSTPTTPSASGKIMIKLRLPLVESTLEKTVIVTENQTANDFIKQMFTKYYEKPLLAKGVTKQASDFVLKATGFAEYINGDKLVSSFEYVKKALLKSTQIPLSLVEAQATAENDIYVEDFPDEQFLQDPVYKYDHEEIKSDLANWDTLTSISIWEMTRTFRVKVVGVENIKQKLEPEHQIFITAGLYHGGELAAPLITSQITSFSNNPRWYEWLTFNIQMCNIPRATRICFTLFARSSSKDDVPLGWVASQLFDYKHELRTGLMSLNLWPDDKANPIGTCVGYNYPNAATLFVEFETYTLPVVFPTEPCKNVPIEMYDTGNSRKSTTLNPKATKLMGMGVSQIDKLIATDPLYTLSDTDKKALWQDRDYLKTKPKSLPKLLLSVPYNDRFSVQIMHELLATWPPISAVDALELLDSKNADDKVREFSVRCLEQLSDDELLDFLLQLVQVLKYEPYHDSELARFLLRRALKNRRVGHALFWYLRSEMHVQEISERYGLLLEAYLRGCGSHRAELGRQTALLKELVRVATMLKAVKEPDQRRAVLKEELPKIQFQTKVQLPLDPSIEVQGFKFEKCKFMDSKKVPLWLVFNNADLNGPPKYVIFKEGDDLRQDMLTLQMIRLMDKLWKNEGLDLQMNAYGCISTGDEEGMIEVVLNSDTVANITKNAGGATAAFREDTIANWLRSLTKSDEDYAKVVENFINSCAGYCVATYVLGIGDRHNDNLMITKDGKLFHIDFGHFLGNYKKKFGFKRERAPFVFTPDFAYVMGRRDSKDFMRFCEVSCKAYNVLRRYANVFINLFAMMLSTGIPELQSEEDISYLREAFSLDMNDAQAREKFKNLIYESLTTKTTQFNNAIHILAH